MMRRRAAVALFSVAIAGCVSTSPPIQPPPVQAPPESPRDISAIPEPVPKPEPRSTKGNPPFYEVFGKRYFVMPQADGYIERGVASWYGPGFHEERTANGEAYDMYGMTAAHKTLPLPAYVQVTNLSNGRSVVVRVNDRGPFKDARIIDLSYTAAARLDMLKAGTAFVEVRALTPGQPAPVTTQASPASGPLFVQAGAFATEANATNLLTRLKALGIGNAFVRQDAVNGKPLYRVRVGPVQGVDEFDRIVARLKSLGFADARLALN